MEPYVEPVATSNNVVDEVTEKERQDAAVAAYDKADTDLKAKLAAQEAPAPVAPTVPERPESIPEKFWDAEKGEVRQDALLKSYLALESGKPVDEEAEAASSAEDTPAEAGNPIASAEAEYAKDGKLSDETYAAFEKVGFSKDAVDAEIAHRTGAIDQIQNQAFEITGGQENYTDMLTWANGNLTDAEKAQFNAATESDVLRTPAITEMYAKYAATLDQVPTNMIHGNKTGAPAVQGFKSKAEMTSAMASPQYKTDAAFRAEVARKIQLAESAGVNLTSHMRG